MSHKCNDFIIKDGKFIRDFEGMYKNFNDPWDQEAFFNKQYGPNLAISAIKIAINDKNMTINNVLDIGCASGYFAPHLLALPSKNYLGTDVSETIIKKAIKKNKDKRSIFKCEDVLIKYNSLYKEKYELIFCAGTLFYVNPEIAEGKVLENIYNYCKKGGLFTYVYSYRKGKSFTDKYITHDEIRNKLKKYFEEDFFCEIELKDNEKVAIGILKKN